MPEQIGGHVVYLYDGTLSGLYCCVFDSVYRKEMPFAIVSLQKAEPMLFETRYVKTEQEHAARVRKSISEKISQRALFLVETVFLSCLEEKELCILRFLLLGYQEGAKAVDMLGEKNVAAMWTAYRHFFGEQHLLLGFIRFSDYDGSLFATISPKNFVLPYLSKHFIERLGGMQFCIYDNTHGAALFYDGQSANIVEMGDLQLKPPNEKEEKYRALWKEFYKTISIEARFNPKCCRTHMPKRYWKNMLEVKEEL